MIRQTFKRPDDEGQITKVVNSTQWQGGGYDADSYRALLSPKGRANLEHFSADASAMTTPEVR